MVSALPKPLRGEEEDYGKREPVSSSRRLYEGAGSPQLSGEKGNMDERENRYPRAGGFMRVPSLLEH